MERRSTRLKKECTNIWTDGGIGKVVLSQVVKRYLVSGSGYVRRCMVLLREPRESGLVKSLTVAADSEAAV